MDERQTLTARDIVNGYSETELFHIIRDYGEDKFAKNIAKHIVLAREEKPIETTYELNEIIKAAIPAKMRETGGHPSKRTYQAIRIALNREQSGRYDQNFKSGRQDLHYYVPFIRGPDCKAGIPQE